MLRVAANERASIYLRATPTFSLPQLTFVDQASIGSVAPAAAASIPDAASGTAGLSPSASVNSASLTPNSSGGSPPIVSIANGVVSPATEDAAATREKPASPILAAKNAKVGVSVGEMNGGSGVESPVRNIHYVLPLKRLIYYVMCGPKFRPTESLPLRWSPCPWMRAPRRRTKSRP